MISSPDIADGEPGLSETKFITGNNAVAEAVRLCRPQLVAAYPITPQTPIYEKLSDWDTAGDLGGVMMRMESEHSAMAA